ncbi:MAG: hypothetical protein LAP85_01655 [Acidobacteriia bacterium]|nr:hypothetical protein [Terriglobia bacterium]
MKCCLAGKYRRINVRVRFRRCERFLRQIYLMDALKGDTQFPWDRVSRSAGENKGFNAAELDERDTNGLQAARNFEEVAKGNKLPIAGISDAHGVEKAESFGRFYTICFAPTAEFADIKASILDCWSVAVEAIAANRPRPFGPFRLVKLSHFLLREIFPQHDELCPAEGASILQHAAGDPGAVAQLRLMQGQVARLYGQYWGK